MMISWDDDNTTGSVASSRYKDDDNDDICTIFQTLLPRESNTKNVDAALLGVLSFPAFATHDEELYQKTKKKVVDRLDDMMMR